MTKRVLLVSEDGTAEVNGVKVRVVPVEPTDEMIRANLDCQDYDPEDPAESVVYCLYCAMLSAVAIDLSSLPVVPERKTNLHLEAKILRGYQDGWNAALYAIGA